MRKQKAMTFDELLKDLQGQKAMKEDPNRVSLNKLFNEAFMRKFSGFSSFGEFMEKGNFQADSLEDIDKLHGELFDRHIARETDFKDWASMLAAASEGIKSQ